MLEVSALPFRVSLYPTYEEIMMSFSKIDIYGAVRNLTYQIA